MFKFVRISHHPDMLDLPVSILIVPLSYQAVYDMMEITLKILNPDLDEF